MKRSELKEKTTAAFNETRDALQQVFDAITNQGQKKKILKNEDIVKLFDHYGVKYEEAVK